MQKDLKKIPSFSTLRLNKFDNNTTQKIVNVDLVENDYGQGGRRAGTGTEGGVSRTRDISVPGWTEQLTTSGS